MTKQDEYYEKEMRKHKATIVLTLLIGLIVVGGFIWMIQLVA